MAFTIQEAILETGDEYQLRLLAGKKGNNRNVSWVHVIEDVTIIRNFWGNELAVTLGINIHSEQDLLKIIDQLIEHRACGLIINIGDYIRNVSDRIIDYCDKHDFPLLTVPWEIYVADMVKDYCMRILLSEQDEIQYAKAFQNAIKAPLNVDDYKKTLQAAFDVDEPFQVAVLFLEASERRDLFYMKKAEARLKVILEKIPYPYSFFQNDVHFVLIINHIPDDELEAVMRTLENDYKMQTEDDSMVVGIGEKASDVTKISEAYLRARAAMRMAYHCNDKKIVRFQDMGVKQILFTTENEEILFGYYRDTLRIVRDYDKKHHSNYEETLEQYIKCNGSIIQVAENLFTHRNTINYRINKIKELIQNQLETSEERFPYEMAFFIKDCFPDIGNE